MQDSGCPRMSSFREDRLMIRAVNQNRLLLARMIRDDMILGQPVTVQTIRNRFCVAGLSSCRRG